MPISSLPRCVCSWRSARSAKRSCKRLRPAKSQALLTLPLYRARLGPQPTREEAGPGLQKKRRSETRSKATLKSPGTQAIHWTPPDEFDGQSKRNDRYPDPSSCIYRRHEYCSSQSASEEWMFREGGPNTTWGFQLNSTVFHVLKRPLITRDSSIGHIYLHTHTSRCLKYPHLNLKALFCCEGFLWTLETWRLQNCSVNSEGNPAIVQRRDLGGHQIPLQNFFFLKRDTYGSISWAQMVCHRLMVYRQSLGGRPPLARF